MSLYRFELNGASVSLVQELQVKENASNFSLLSNPQKRIPKKLVGRINPEDMSLYSTSPSPRDAAEKFVTTLINQADAYLHVSNQLKHTAQKLQEEFVH